MDSYSQNREDVIVFELFERITKRHYGEHFVGNVLDLGSNDGTSLSNSRLLIENGWRGVLVEPSPIAFSKLSNFYKSNPSIQCLQVAIADFDGEAEFYESGTHLGKGDAGLLSSLDANEIKRWGNTTEFVPVMVPVVSVNTFMQKSIIKTFDFISIDCEGFDYLILSQMNLIGMKTCCVCIEWNSQDFDKYNDWFIKNWPGCQLVHKNAENLIYYRQYRTMGGVTGDDLIINEIRNKYVR